MHRRTLLALAASSLALLTLGVTRRARTSTASAGRSFTKISRSIWSTESPRPGRCRSPSTRRWRKGAVKVHETGNVNELQIENLGTDEVFVQSGDIVKGGQQDRVLTVSLLLPPKSGRIPIASFCVEQGRWTARGKEDVKTFATASAVGALARSEDRHEGAGRAVADPAPIDGCPASRRAAHGARRPRRPARGSRRCGARCARCRTGCRRTSARRSMPPASQSSLQLALENEKLKDAQAAYVEGAASAPARRTTTSSATCSPSTASSTARRSIRRTACSGRCGRSCCRRASPRRSATRTPTRDAGAAERGRAGVPRRRREGQGEREAASRRSAARDARRRQGVLFRDAARERRLRASQLSGEIGVKSVRDRGPPWATHGGLFYCGRLATLASAYRRRVASAKGTRRPRA